MNAGPDADADAVVPVVPAVALAAPRWIHPSIVMESAFAVAGARWELCGSGDLGGSGDLCGSGGLCGSGAGESAPAAGGDTRGVDGEGGCCVACAASDAHRSVAKVLARNILLILTSSSSDEQTLAKQQVERHLGCVLVRIARDCRVRRGEVVAEQHDRATNFLARD